MCESKLVAHVDYVLCKQYGFAMTNFFVFLHQSGSKEINFNTTVKPYLRSAIVCCKSATKASLLHEIALLLTKVK